MAWPRVAPREKEEEFWEEENTEKKKKQTKITLPICPSLPLCVLSRLQAQTALFLEQEKEKT